MMAPVHVNAQQHIRSKFGVLPAVAWIYLQCLHLRQQHLKKSNFIALVHVLLRVALPYAWKLCQPLLLGLCIQRRHFPHHVFINVHCQSLHHGIQPRPGSLFSRPGRKAMFFAFAASIGPLIGTLWARVVRNHWYYASSTSAYNRSLTLFR